MIRSLLGMLYRRSAPRAYAPAATSGTPMAAAPPVGARVGEDVEVPFVAPEGPLVVRLVVPPVLPEVWEVVAGPPVVLVSVVVVAPVAVVLVVVAVVSPVFEDSLPLLEPPAPALATMWNWFENWKCSGASSRVKVRPYRGALPSVSLTAQSYFSRLFAMPSGETQ